MHKMEFSKYSISIFGSNFRGVVRQVRKAVRSCWVDPIMEYRSDKEVVIWCHRDDILRDGERYVWIRDMGNGFIHINHEYGGGGHLEILEFLWINVRKIDKIPAHVTMNGAIYDEEDPVDKGWIIVRKV